MSEYTTQAKIESFLNRDLTVNEEALLPSVIEYISNFIRSYTGRDWNSFTSEWVADADYEIGDLASFNDITYECTINHTSDADKKPGVGDDWADYWELADDVDTRLYDGNGEKEIYIDDFISLSEIGLLDSQGDAMTTLTDDDEWLLSPPNKTTKQTIYLRNYRFPIGRARVLVTGVFGSGAVPAPVVMVCTALSGNYIGRMGTKAGGFESESIEGYSYRLMSGKGVDEETRTILATLDNYRKLIL